MHVESILALSTLVLLEIVLGIDNIVFIAVLTERAPKADRPRLRRLGLLAAMLMRIGLLLTLAWVTRLTTPLFEILGKGFSGKELVLLGGGLFLLAKATVEIRHEIEAQHEQRSPEMGALGNASIILQIMILDIVFSLDSVITAVGMTNEIWIMVTAVVVSIAVMMLFANVISEFILNHPTVKMLALSFLILIGVFLIADGLGQHIEKGYIYFAMAFSMTVEFLNLRKRRKQSVGT